MDNKQCSANITHGVNCDQHIGMFSSTGTGDSVSTPPLKLIDGVTEYCYLVTASSGTVSVIIEGSLDIISIGNR